MARQSFLFLLIALHLSGCHAPSAAKEGKLPRVKASNVVELKKLVGQDVTAYGQVASTYKSKNSGVQILNFHGDQLSAVCVADDVPKFKDGAPADYFKGKYVEISGRLRIYKGKLQLPLTSPDFIKIYDPAAARRERVELKQIGQDSWMSPAGLVYAGFDPQGLSRVDHVRRHMKDIPQRDGPHGVFDGDEGVAWAVIDEAWRIAEERNLKPQREDARSTYTVSLGRRIGYLGGRTGAANGHPPLTRVFIVFETNTKNIITAFPK